MSEFRVDQKKLIFDAVRYYQMNKFGPFSKVGYDKCDEILNSLYDAVRTYEDRPDCDI